MKALDFVIESRAGIQVLDWSKCGGIGCRPANDAEITMYAELRRLAEVNAELLGALEEAKNAITSLGDMSDGDVSPYAWKSNKCADVEKKAEAAIAKAKEQQ